MQRQPQKIVVITFDQCVYGKLNSFGLYNETINLWYFAFAHFMNFLISIVYIQVNWFHVFLILAFKIGNGIGEKLFMLSGLQNVSNGKYVLSFL